MWISWVLAITGLVLVVGGWMLYLALIPKEKVPENPIVFTSTMIVGCLAAVAALVEPLRAGLWQVWGLWAAMAVSVSLGGFFLYLLRLAPLPDTKIQVHVGEMLPAFTALDAQGQSQDSTSWRGQRVLLKFFRGHW